MVLYPTQLLITGQVIANEPLSRAVGVGALPFDGAAGLVEIRGAQGCAPAGVLLLVGRLTCAAGADREYISPEVVLIVFHLNAPVIEHKTNVDDITGLPVLQAL